MKIWNTEVHAEFAKGSANVPTAGQAQLERIQHLVSISDTYHVTRIYYYNYQQQSGEDRGLVAPHSENSGTRPAWRYFKKRLLKCRPKQKGCKRPEASANTQALMTEPEGWDEGGESGVWDPALEPEESLEPTEPEGGWPVLSNALLEGFDMTAATIADNPLEDAEGGVEIPDSDVDGDGFSDLVALHSDNTVYAYPGSYDEHFEPSFEGSVASLPGLNSAHFDGTGHYAIDVDDVNGDFSADLVTLTSGGTACVFLGQDDDAFGSQCIGSFAGTMSPGIQNPGGHEPIGVADVTGDGRGDLVTFEGPSATIKVFRGASNGTFASGVPSFAGAMNSATFDSSGTYFVDVSDVTGDGRADLVGLATAGVGSVMVYAGRADGTFAAGVASFPNAFDVGFVDSSGHEPLGVADVTGDGLSDLVTFWSPGSLVFTYPGQANGTFGTGTSSVPGLNSSLFDRGGWEFNTLLDVNGDGLADLVSTSTNADLEIFAGNTSGAFSAGTVVYDGAWDASRLDGTGHEIVTEKPGFRRHGCFPGGCAGRSTPKRVDFSGDGRADVIARHPNGTLWLYRGNGAGAWLNDGAATLLGGGGWENFDRLVAPGDFSGDGKADVIVRRPEGTLWMYRGNAAGAWVTGNAELIGGGGWQVYDMLFSPGDFSGDGKADLIARRPDGTLWLYLGDGAGLWLNNGNAAQIGSGWNSFDTLVGVGDFSGDSRADVIGRRPDGTLWLYKGNGAGAWLDGGNPTPIGAEWNGYDMLIGAGDFSGDGKADLLARRPDGSFWMYRGNGASAWLANGAPTAIGAGWNGFNSLLGP